jgi:hypothetical protein
MIKKTEDENYQKFLKGTFWIKGWDVRAKEILTVVPDGNKVEIKNLLSELGEKIGREWSKDPLVRKIDSGMLRKWGNELKKVIAEDQADLVKYLRVLEEKVNKILSKNAQA